MNLNPAFLKNRSSNAGLLISRAAYLESIAQIQGLARRKEQMKIGILGAGRIGAVAARLFVVAGHDVAVSNSRGPESLRELVATLGPRSHASDIAGAAAFGELVLLAVP